MRQPGAGDIALLCDFAGKAFDEATGLMVSKALLDFVEGRLGAENSVYSRYWVCEYNQRVAGMIGLFTLRWVGPQVRYLGWFFVDPDLQGKGIGSALLAYMIEVAKSEGARWLLVETEGSADAAHRVYSRAGFQELARISAYWPSGEELVLLGLGLT